MRSIHFPRLRGHRLPVQETEDAQGRALELDDDGPWDD
jgi:hypothetical protein